MKNMAKEVKKEIGITAEKDDFSEWFAQLMLKADLADYTDVSGCIIIKPSAYSIWEKIKEEVDKRFKKLGVQNCSFPLFIPEKLFNIEKEHVKGFSPEVAWVTEAGGTKLNERLAIRPTSETIMYPSYAKWIRSWRNLPLKLNQWNNVVRWEFSHPVPFFRGREFLWNELHTALASEKEAMTEGKQILDAYSDVCENFMALYGMTGKKTEKEKFAGGVASWKIHYIIPSGRIIEGPCFHHDGQNFSKAYGIKYLDESGKEQFVWQNTYAISTRMLGTMFAMHSDDKGLILPPKMAEHQIVIVPILFDDSKTKVLKTANEISSKLKEFNAFVDERGNYKPGFKFNEWELKGIPVRIEIGPKDLESNSVIVVRRDSGKKEIVKISDLSKKIPAVLDDIQSNLFEKSKKLFKEKVVKAKSLSELKKIIDDKKVGIVPLCKNIECEDMLKAETKGAKAVFISEEKIKSEKCIICNKKADYLVYAGKVY
jgi:prolyl-tRNA synthetase